jgi:hypothetical protein
VRTEVGPHNTIGVAMEDLRKVERKALKKELKEEMAEARRRKLACLQKTCMGVIKKTVPPITTTATATPTITPNLTLEELVTFMDVAVASRYGNDLTNFTHTITEEVHSTLDTFKTDLENTLPWQIRSVVQQVQGESQDKQPIVEPTTHYLGSTSTPCSTSKHYLGNTTAPGNSGNIASTSTLHPSNTSGNIIYVDSTSPYPGCVSMGNPGSFLTSNLSYPGAHPLRVNWGFLLTPHRPTQSRTFSNRITKPWLTVPAYLPRVRVFLMVLFLTHFSIGHRLTLLLTRV